EQLMPVIKATSAEMACTLLRAVLPVIQEANQEQLVKALQADEEKGQVRSAQTKDHLATDQAPASKEVARQRPEERNQARRQDQPELDAELEQLLAQGMAELAAAKLASGPRGQSVEPSPKGSIPAPEPRVAAAAPSANQGNGEDHSPEEMDAVPAC